VEDRVNRRKAAQQPKATRADEEAAIEDAVQDQQRLSAGLSADDRRPTEVNDIDDER
jgi:hypothetical protein